MEAPREASDLEDDATSFPSAEGADPPSSEADSAKFASKFNELVAAGRGGLLLDLMAANLDGPIDGTTWESLYRAIDLLVGSEVLRKLLWAARASPNDIRADFRDEGISGVAQDLMTQILLRYGGRILSAFGQSRLAGAPDDWDLIDPEVLLNLSEGGLEVSTLIRKKNGQTMLIRGSLASFLRWLGVMHDAVLLVTDRRAFREADIERLLEQIDAIRSMLTDDSEARTPLDG